MSGNPFEKLLDTSLLLDLLSFLPSDGLAAMEVTCTRMAARVIIGSTDDLHADCKLLCDWWRYFNTEGEDDPQSATPEYLSAPQEIARRSLFRCTPQERTWIALTRQHCWTVHLHEVEQLPILKLLGMQPKPTST